MGTTGRERMLSLIVSSTTSSAPSSSRTAAVRRSSASGQRTSRSHVQASWFAVVSWPASTSVSSSSRSSRSVSASPSSVRARISSDMMSVRSSRSVARRRSAIIWKVGLSITFIASLVRPTGSARPMLVSSPIWATGLVDSSVRRRVRVAQPALGRALRRLALHAEDPAHDHVQRDGLHPRRQRHRLAHRPAVQLALGDLVDHLHVTRHRLAVERRQQQLALAQVPVAERRQHRVRAQDRPQRRLAGQRRRQSRLCREQRLHVVGVTGDRRARRG